MKFTIRDLFLVTMIVAVALGWWLEHGKFRRLDADFKVMRDELNRARKVNQVKALVDSYRGTPSVIISTDAQGNTTRQELPPPEPLEIVPPLPNPSAPAPNKPKK
jgi:hypothetical protein